MSELEDLPGWLRSRFQASLSFDGTRWWILAGDTSFTETDIALLANYQVGIDVRGGTRKSPTDLAARRRELTAFPALRLSSATQDGFSSLDLIQHLTQLDELSLKFGTDMVNVSRLVNLRHLEISGPSALTATTLPHLRSLDLTIEEIPAGWRLESHLEALAINLSSPSISLEFLKFPDALRSLGIGGVEIVDLEVVSRLDRLAALEIAFVSSIVECSFAANFKSIESVRLISVKSVDSVSAWVNLPNGAVLAVQENYVFPPAFKAAVAHRGWWFDKYLSDHNDENFPFDVEGDEEDGFEVTFSAWGLLDALVGDNDSVADRISTDILSEVLLRQLDRSGVSMGVDDSEGDVVRIVFSRLDDARAAAQALSKQWRSPRRLVGDIKRVAQRYN